MKKEESLLDEYSIFSDKFIPEVVNSENMYINEPINNMFNSKFEEIINDKQLSFLHSFKTKLTFPPKKNIISANYKYSESNCSSCYACLYNQNKFICTICPLTKLCANCENYHMHPMIKLRKTDLSEISETKSLMLKGLGFKIRNSSITLKAKLETSLRNIAVCQNQKFVVSINITNECNFELSASTKLIAKNNMDLVINNFSFPFELKKKEVIKVDLVCFSANTLKQYKVEFILFDKEGRINCNSLLVDIEVRKDIVEENLNSLFKDYPYIVELPKQKKQIINQILLSGLVNNSEEAFNYMERSSWKLK